MALDLQIAVTPWSAPNSWQADELCAQAEMAEAMGCHSFWLPENHFGGPRSIPSPLLLLAAVAARTRRIRLGSTSYLLPIRNPVLAAEEVAVLDQLSRGRVILGVGRGIQDSVFRAFELQPSEKRKLFKRNLDLMCRAWRGEPLPGGAGEDPIRLGPLPVQQPHPPIWVAAFGPLALKQVAGLGLPYLASPVESLGSLEDNYRLYRSHLEASEHAPVSTVPVMRTVLVTPDAGLAQRVKDALQRDVPQTMRERAGGVDDWAIVGDGHYVLDKVSEYAERLGMSHLIARGRLPSISTDQQVASHQRLLELVGGTPR